MADGSYGSYTFDDGGSGMITIKKATATDHGTDTGWQDGYGDGQAVFNDNLRFFTGNYTFDGNGSNPVPSDDISGYGFKIASNSMTNSGGIIAFGNWDSGVSDISLRYTHVYNTYNGSVNCGTVGLRFNPSNSHRRIKVQNCFLENSGKDGIQISRSSFLLFENCYIKRYGLLEAGSPDVHGQTVQIFYGGSDIVFRWNIWEANEGQSLVAIGSGGSERIRFYGNLVFNKTGQTSAASGGFNTSGGIVGNAWTGGHNGIYVYNNTVVNIGGAYGGHSHFPMHVSGTGGQNEYGYNNLFYNCGGNGGASGWSDWGYHASGGGNVYGGNNEQTGLGSTIFADYAGNDFSLTYGTAAGLALTSQSWWNNGGDSFFGTIDSDLDMLGNARGSDGTWDRGAYEYGGIPKVADPVISPDGGTFSNTVTVTLSSNTPDAEIRYTTDGSDPTESSVLYTSPFAISQTATVKVRGYKDAMNPSLISSATFTEGSDPGAVVVIEAEDMTLDGNYIIDDEAPLSGTAIKIDYDLGVPATGEATTTFTGASGTYTVRFTIIPEHDGTPQAKVYVGSTLIIDEEYPMDPAWHNHTYSEDVEVTGITIIHGDVITIEGTSNTVSGAALARVDKITFVLESVGINDYSVFPQPGGVPSILDRAQTYNVFGQRVDSFRNTGVYIIRNKSGISKQVQVK